MIANGFLSSMLESLPELVIAVDSRCRIAFCNRSLAGVAASALVGRDLLSLTPQEHRAAVRSHIASVFGDGRRCVENEHTIGPPHERRSYENVYCPVRGEGTAEVDKVLIVSRDITPRKRTEERLRQSARRLEAAQQVARMGHWEWDIRTDRVHWSAELYRMAALPVNTPISSKIFFALVHPDDRQRVRRVLDGVNRTGRRREFEHRIARADGSVRILHCCAERVDHGGRHQQLVGTARDITRDKEVELERRHLLAQARAAMRSRDAFLAIAAHELKTPLTTMKLQLQHLLLSWRGVLKPLPSGQVQAKIDAALDQIERVRGLVDRVVEMPELVAGEVELKRAPGDLRDVVRRVVDRHQREADKRGCDLTVQVPHPVEGRWDARRITELLEQLMSNALKFGAGKQVEVGVEARRNIARLWVRDRGMGIRPEDRRRIFARFERAVPDRHYGGVGLGLWVAHKLVRAMDGRIRVESSPGEGATFWVTLPREVAAERRRPPRLQLLEAQASAAM